MKSKLDENMPAVLADYLRELGHDVHTGRLALAQAVTRLFASEVNEDWPGCFLVLTERKLRIHRP